MVRTHPGGQSETGERVFGTPNDLIFAAGIGDEVENPFLEVYEHGLITPNEDDDDDHGSS